MSLPMPTTSPMNMDPKKLQAMEAPLIALANSCGGDLRALLYAFFGFLNRRTDFYMVPHDDDLKAGTARMGFKEGDAEKLVLAAFRQFPLRRVPPQGKTKESMPKKAEPAPKEKEAKTESQAATKPSASNAKDSSGSKSDVRLTEEGKQVPVGNGGSTSRYKWTQTIDECTVLLGLPPGTRAKELSVSIKPTSISVCRKAKAEGEDEPYTFVSGTLTEKVKPDESTWSIEGGVMIIILYKAKKTFWETIVEGDEKIDTSLVDSRRHIREYDEATQGQIRRIIFDESQRRKGGATSDEIAGKPHVPPLPPGVEFIDKETLNKNDKNS